MTTGTLFLLAVGVAAWLAARALDRWDERRGGDRNVQLASFLVMMFGAAVPLVLVVTEVVARSRTNEWTAVVIAVVCCLRPHRLIWKRRGVAAKGNP